MSYGLISSLRSNSVCSALGVFFDFDHNIGAVIVRIEVEGIYCASRTLRDAILIVNKQL